MIARTVYTNNSHIFPQANVIILLASQNANLRNKLSEKCFFFLAPGSWKDIERSRVINTARWKWCSGGTLNTN